MSSFTCFKIGVLGRSRFHFKAPGPRFSRVGTSQTMPEGLFWAACETHFQLALSNHSWPISTFFRAVRSRNSVWSVLSPILSFPQEAGDHRKPDAKKRKSLVFSHFWSIFSPSEPRLKNDIEKTSKKVRKSRILASQNPPKTKPKSCFFWKRRFLTNRAPA